MVKTFKKSSSLVTKRLITLKLGMQHQVLEYYQVCSSDDLDLSYGKVKYLLPYVFVWEQTLTVDFLETIESWHIKSTK